MRTNAVVAQLIERFLAKEEVASLSLVYRSKIREANFNLDLASESRSGS